MSKKISLILSVLMSILIFILLRLSVNAIINLPQLIFDITGYFFAIRFDDIVFMLFSSIPTIARLALPKQQVYSIVGLFKAAGAVLLCVLIVCFIACAMLIFIGKSKNPLIPPSLLSEPFPFYTSFAIQLGLAIGYFSIKLKHHNKLEALLPRDK